MHSDCMQHGVALGVIGCCAGPCGVNPLAALATALHKHQEPEHRPPNQLKEKLYYDGVEAKGSASGLCVGKDLDAMGCLCLPSLACRGGSAPCSAFAQLLGDIKAAAVRKKLRRVLSRKT